MAKKVRKKRSGKGSTVKLSDELVLAGDRPGERASCEGGVIIYLDESDKEALVELFAARLNKMTKRKNIDVALWEVDTDMVKN
ncbi:MAG: hypothetical protein JKX85_01335, partial [Phycisphaeraceae bacterium]|nr:hypothetical protein [Phycisphaeraceae bacterium]